MFGGFTNTKNTPIEALERHFPLRVLRDRLRRGSGGDGLARSPGAPRRSRLRGRAWAAAPT